MPCQSEAKLQRKYPEKLDLTNRESDRTRVEKESDCDEAEVSKDWK